MQPAEAFQPVDWTCPFCHKGEPEFNPQKLQFRCQRCHALGHHLIFLKRVLSQAAYTSLQDTIKTAPIPHPQKTCPGCRKLMCFVSLERDDRKNALGYCSPCRWVWSETVEFLHSFSRQGQTVLERAQMQATNIDPDNAVEVELKQTMAFSIEPTIAVIEGQANEILNPIAQHDTPRTARYSCAIVALCLVVTCLGKKLPYAELFVFDPRHPLAYGGLPVLLSGFAHGHAAHLIGNAIEILTLGWILENELKRASSVLWLFLGAVILGNIFHASFGLPIPVIGASGGARGLLAFYVMLFPWVRFTKVRKLHYSLYAIIKIGAPAYLTAVTFIDFIGGWSLVTAIGAQSAPHAPMPGGTQYILSLCLIFLQNFVPQWSSTASFAHLGGTAFGLIYSFWGDSQMRKAKVRVSTAAPSRRRDGSRRRPIPSAQISGFPNGISPGHDPLEVYAPPVRTETVVFRAKKNPGSK